ncbi:MAG TPA: imidazole glycerol phosphate synthase subunit HisH [Terriglobales bacterium]|nr:imidazole glycerol phosphate synthase subunit HisH [Terriglobales bacterium]
MIAIVDYRAGNIASVKKALERVGGESVITSDAGVIAQAERIVLPGVGHFAATRALDPLRLPITAAIRRGKPFLGICVGLQWMFAGSTEAPGISGFGLFAGEVSKFPPGVKSPHVGWNQISVRDGSRLLAGIPTGAFVYFTHSYRAPLCEGTIADCDYGGPFAAAVERDNVFGVQFHPEKSGDTGLEILKNFLAC